MDLPEYEQRRHARGRLARLAVGDARARRALLAGWAAAGVRAPEDVFAGVRVPEGVPIRWLPWALGIRGADPGSVLGSEGMWDLAVIRTTAGIGSDGGDEGRGTAALYLAARLGEDVHAREGLAARAAVFPATTRDPEAAAWWARVLAGYVDLTTGRVFRGLYGDAVKQAFLARCLQLRLSPEVARRHAGSALDLLDCVAFGPHVEVAARLVEGTGEPIAALAACLTGTTMPLARSCCAARSGWRETLSTLGGPTWGEDDEPARPALLAGAAATHVARRLRSCLDAGDLPEGPLGLPGWPVVTQNRGRIRGRLRGLIREDPRAVARLVSSLGAPWARTRAAVARHAWDWAWREARAGFSFSMEAMTAPGCVPAHAAPGETAPPPEPPLPEDAVLTLLLHWVGRGAWDDVGEWARGGAGRSLSDAFYRGLKAAPAVLADPGGGEGRSRTYTRLRAHLAEGLGAYVPRLREAARRVGSVRVDRRLKAAVHGALRPYWRDDLLPLPEHHLPGFRAACRVMANQVPAATEGTG